MTRAVNTAAVGIGGVIQAVLGSTQTITTTTSQALVTTNITATITPTANTSRILVQAVVPITWSNTTGPGVALYRNGSLLFNPSAQDTGGRFYATYGFAGYLMVPLNFIDTPNTTTATTYTIFISSYNGTATVSAPFAGNAANATGTILLTELAG